MIGLPHVLLLGAGCLVLPLRAQESPNWLSEPVPAVTIRLDEPTAEEVVVVINDNALGGNHAGLFAGKILYDPAGSYVGMRRQDKTWSAASLADYARYQTTDGLKVRFYRFRLSEQAMTQLQQRIADASPTPPLFCASAVQNVLVGIAPFDGLESTGLTTPSALGRRLDSLIRGASAVGECQQLDATRC